MQALDHRPPTTDHHRRLPEPCASPSVYDATWQAAVVKWHNKVTRQTTRSQNQRRRFLRYASLALAEAADLIEAGLDGSRISELQERLELTSNELSRLITIPDRTLARRKQQDRLPPDESERVFRIGRLADLTEAALGGRSNAVQWLKEPNLALGNAKPLEMANTEPGARLVEQLLGRIEHGVTV